MTETCGCDDSQYWRAATARAASEAISIAARLYLKRLECIAMKLQLRERCIYQDGATYNGMAVCSAIPEIREKQERRKRTWENRTKRIDAALTEARRL